MIKSCFIPCVFALLFLSPKAFCQKSDTIPSTRIIASDSVPPAINWKESPAKKPFPVKSFLVPSLMVAYGITSLSNNNLQHVNNVVKDEVWTENPHGKTAVDNFLAISPAVAVYVLNAAGVKGKNNFKDRTIIYGMANLISGSVVFSVKSLTHETRPDGSNNLSFPSGHTATAFVAAEFLRQEYKDVSPWYGVAGYVAAATTGYLRVYNNKHWCGDVIAGAGVGIISTKLAYLLYPTIKRTFYKKSEVKTLVMPTYQNGAFGFGMVHKF
jgi:hypothetical protein